MKNTLRNILLVLAILTASTAHGAGMGGVDVTAKDKGGKVVYLGKTDSGGKFSTPTLSPGVYVFEFRSKQAAGFQVALAGPKTAKQTKGSGAGLAFSIDVAPAAKISGQVTAAQSAVKAGEKLPPNVRIIKGRRYVLEAGELGSNMGAKWVPEEEARARDPNAGRNSREFLQRTQELGSQGN